MKPGNCPYCAGTGSVSAKKAARKLVSRDRGEYNAAMREINKRARERKKLALVSKAP